jgi:hypothetical protein
VLQKETKNPTIDMAKLQIKSEKPLLLADFFSGRGANPLTLTLTVQNSATLLLREKGERESLYLYIYINIKIYY